MQTATSETESKSRDLSICVHHYTLREPCPKGQGKILEKGFDISLMFFFLAPERKYWRQDLKLS